MNLETAIGNASAALNSSGCDDNNGDNASWVQDLRDAVHTQPPEERRIEHVVAMLHVLASAMQKNDGLNVRRLSDVVLDVLELPGLALEADVVDMLWQLWAVVASRALERPSDGLFVVTTIRVARRVVHHTRRAAYPEALFPHKMEMAAVVAWARHRPNPCTLAAHVAFEAELLHEDVRMWPWSDTAVDKKSVWSWATASDAQTPRTLSEIVALCRDRHNARYVFLNDVNTRMIQGADVAARWEWAQSEKETHPCQYNTLRYLAIMHSSGQSGGDTDDTSQRWHRMYTQTCEYLASMDVDSIAPSALLQSTHALRSLGTLEAILAVAEAVRRCSRVWLRQEEASVAVLEFLCYLHLSNSVPPLDEPSLRLAMSHFILGHITSCSPEQRRTLREELVDIVSLDTKAFPAEKPTPMSALDDDDDKQKRAPPPEVLTLSMADRRLHSASKAWVPLRGLPTGRLGVLVGVVEVSDVLAKLKLQLLRTAFSVTHRYHHLMRFLVLGNAVSYKEWCDMASGIVEFDHTALEEGMEDVDSDALKLIKQRDSQRSFLHRHQGGVALAVGTALPVVSVVSGALVLPALITGAATLGIYGLFGRTAQSHQKAHLQHLCATFAKVPCVVDDDSLVLADMVKDGGAKLEAVLTRWEENKCTRCPMHSYLCYLLGLLAWADGDVDVARDNLDEAEHYMATPQLLYARCLLECDAAPNGHWLSSRGCDFIRTVGAPYGTELAEVMAVVQLL
eukprot:PhM_4_TR8918/c0_g1_i1/m.6335